MRLLIAAEKQTSHLAALPGPSFDFTYVDDQVNYYRRVIDTFDITLIPSTSDPQERRWSKAVPKRESLGAR